MSEDALGDRMKAYESVTTSRKAYKGQPFCIRLDGRAFHTLTAKLKRPYDAAFSRVMIETTKALVQEFGALVGYTQSDEISLGFFVESGSNSDYPFGGSFQKLESLTASHASVHFNIARLRDMTFVGDWPKLGYFDSRAFVVPNIQELYHCFLWRQNDATKNAISMAAQAHYSHNALMGKSGNEKQEMLHAKGVNFNDYPSFFKRGTFVKRVKRLVEYTPEQLARIPEKHRPTGPIERTVIEEQDYWLGKGGAGVNELFGIGTKSYLDEMMKSLEAKPDVVKVSGEISQSTIDALLENDE